MPRLFALKAQSERIGTLAVLASGAWLSRWNLIAQEKRNGRIRKRKGRRIAVNIAKLPELLGKALKLWRNDPTAYPFDSNNVVAITRILFQSRHAWFCPHQHRYYVDGCGGAVLGMSVALGEIISGAPAPTDSARNQK
jgi:hypothetical protein